MARRGNRSGNKNRVQNVRVLDDYSGGDGAKFDRIISEMQNSHSQVRVLCTGIVPLVTTTAGYTSETSHPFVRSTDDFISMAQQFETYRIKSIRFDVYDINASNVGTGFFSTWHDDVANGLALSFTAPNVYDSPDSQVVPPGTGKISLVWTAKGTFENLFQSCATSGGSPRNFGGIRYTVSGGTDSTSKFQVVVKAVVDFRGRQ